MSDHFHGQSYGYRQGCRCDKCAAWQAGAMRRYRALTPNDPIDHAIWFERVDKDGDPLPVPWKFQQRVAGYERGYTGHQPPADSSSDYLYGHRAGVEARHAYIQVVREAATRHATQTARNVGEWHAMDREKA